VKVRDVSGRVAFHHVAALSLWTTSVALSHEDVLVCSDDLEAVIATPERVLKRLFMLISTAVNGVETG